MSYKSIIAIISLYTLTILSTLNLDYFNKNTQIEKFAEYNLIQQDELLTIELNKKVLTDKISKKIINTNINDTELFEKLKSSYPQILDINIKNTNIELIPEKKNNLNTIIIPTKNNSNYVYEIIVDYEEYSNVEEKQQLRMFTVTHIQNNRWKTNPTIYNPKKKLGLSINDELPDIEPATEEKGISHYIQNEVLIKFKVNIEPNYLKELIKKYNLNIRKQNNNAIIVNSKTNSTKELIKLLRDNEFSSNSPIQYIEPHFIYLTNENNNLNTPNDLLYGDYQWNLPNIFTEKGWNHTKGNENLIIAVIDTGVDLNHPEFEGKLVDGINIIDPNELPMDDDGHGTHVAGIISANTNNKEGIAGITWYNKIMPIKVLDQSGAGTLFDVAEGIIWATDNGAKIINLSLGNYAESEYLHEAIKYAYNKDVVLIAATGNDNTDQLGYPAGYDEVIAVSAIDLDNNRAEFSNYGSYIDVVAPGVNIASTYPDNQYAALSGTSMASPHVAGLAGLIKSLRPELSNSDISDIIKTTSTDLGNPGKDDYYGYGEINIENAIIYANNKKMNATNNIMLDWLLRRIINLKEGV